MKHDSKKAGDFLEGKNSNLQMILFKVQLLKKLNDAFQKHIAPGMVSFCQVANRVGSKLVVVAANGSIATQLRFESIDLLRKFKQDPVLKDIQQIEAKVRPTNLPVKKPKQTNGVAPLSQEAAELIEDIAESITDPKLREALKRIASYSKNKC